MKKVYLIATIVAIITGFATYLFAIKLEEKTMIEDAPSTSVVIAIVDIPENTVVTQEMVMIKQLPIISVTPGAATKIEDVVDKVNNYPIVTGEQLVLSKLGEEDDKSLSLELKDGEYAYTIAVDTITGVAGFISKGDTIDLVHTVTKNGETTISVFMKDIKVLRVSTNAAEYDSKLDGAAPIVSYGELTLCLTEKQVIELTQAQSTGTIRPILKTKQDDKTDKKENITPQQTTTTQETTTDATTAAAS